MWHVILEEKVEMRSIESTPALGKKESISKLISLRQFAATLFSMKFKPGALKIIFIFGIGLTGLSGSLEARTMTGLASWYSTETCKINPNPACPTASGRSLYDLEKEKVNFAAMWGVDFGTSVKVCNQKNERCTTVKIFDRGPSKKLYRAIDLSIQAFSEIADPKEGIINVSVEVFP